METFDEQTIWFMIVLGLIACVLSAIVRIVFRVILPLIYRHVSEDQLPGILLAHKRRVQAWRAYRAPYKVRKHDRRQTWRNARVHDPEDDDDSCAVCESRAVDRLDVGVYKCRECGHVGGSGYADYAKRKLEDKLLSEPMHKRRAKARELLSDVGLSLSALEGHVDAALKFSAWDTSIVLNDSVADDVGQIEKRKQIYIIQEQILRVHDEIRRAGVLLDEDLSALEFDADTTFMLSERWDRWTKQTEEYIKRHEHVIHQHIEALAADVRLKKQQVARKRAELNARPARSGPQW